MEERPEITRLSVLRKILIKGNGMVLPWTELLFELPETYLHFLSMWNPITLEILTWITQEAPRWKLLSNIMQDNYNSNFTKNRFELLQHVLLLDRSIVHIFWKRNKDYTFACKFFADNLIFSCNCNWFSNQRYELFFLYWKAMEMIITDHPCLSSFSSH